MCRKFRKFWLDWCFKSRFNEHLDFEFSSFFKNQNYLSIFLGFSKYPKFSGILTHSGILREFVPSGIPIISESTTFLLLTYSTCSWSCNFENINSSKTKMTIKLFLDLRWTCIKNKHPNVGISEYPIIRLFYMKFHKRMESFRIY